MGFWQVFWFPSGPLNPQRDVLLESRDRTEIIWVLERWLADIAEYKRDQWKYAYTTLGFLGVIGFAFVSSAAWLQPVHGVFGSILAIILYAIWTAAHYSTNAGLVKALWGKEAAYGFLGDPIAVTRRVETSNYVQVSQMLIVAVSIAALLTVVAGMSVAMGAQPPEEALAKRVGKLIVIGRCHEAKIAALRSGDLGLADKSAQLCPRPPHPSSGPRQR